MACKRRKLIATAKGDLSNRVVQFEFQTYPGEARSGGNCCTRRSCRTMVMGATHLKRSIEKQEVETSSQREDKTRYFMLWGSSQPQTTHRPRIRLRDEEAGARKAGGRSASADKLHPGAQCLAHLTSPTTTPLELSSPCCALKRGSHAEPISLGYSSPSVPPFVVTDRVYALCKAPPGCSCFYA